MSASEDIHDAPVIPSRGGVRDPQWRTEFVAFQKLLPSLLPTHKGRFVAVHGGQVVATADNFIDAALQAYKKVGYVTLHVGLVSDAPDQVIHLPSPRVQQSVSA